MYEVNYTKCFQAHWYYYTSRIAIYIASMLFKYYGQVHGEIKRGKYLK